MLHDHGKCRYRLKISPRLPCTQPLRCAVSYRYRLRCTVHVYPFARLCPCVNRPWLFPDAIYLDCGTTLCCRTSGVFSGLSLLHNSTAQSSSTGANVQCATDPLSHGKTIFVQTQFFKVSDSFLPEEAAPDICWRKRINVPTMWGHAGLNPSNAGRGFVLVDLAGSLYSPL